MWLGSPFELRLDWWKAGSGDASLKPWAGTMLASRIALAMQRELPRTLERGFFDDGHVVFGADNKKVEPYYFDARRGANALPLDVGFSPDALSLETITYPVTEFLTLIGVQRFRPASGKTPRVFRFRAWRTDLPIALAALAAANVLTDDGLLFQFENAFRTDQRKHKAFSPAIPINGAGNE
jgi:CRISPR-associated protein Csb3